VRAFGPPLVSLLRSHLNTFARQVVGHSSAKGGAWRGGPNGAPRGSVAVASLSFGNCRMGCSYDPRKPGAARLEGRASGKVRQNARSAGVLAFCFCWLAFWRSRVLAFCLAFWRSSVLAFWRSNLWRSGVLVRTCRTWRSAEPCFREAVRVPCMLRRDALWVRRRPPQCCERTRGLVRCLQSPPRRFKQGGWRVSECVRDCASRYLFQ